MTHQGAFIVLIGPDGVGKTTVARAMLDQAEGRGLYFHFLPDPAMNLSSQIPREVGLIEKNRETGSRPAGVLRILRNLLRSWVTYLAAIRPAVRAGSVVVGDRWLYGYVTQPLAVKFYGPDWLARMVIRAMPQPGLTVLLDAPNELIHARKPELTLTEIEAEKRILKAAVPNAMLVDATQDPSAIADRLAGQIEVSCGYRVYPPFLGQVLLPETPRIDALVGSALYSPSRSRGLIGQRMGRELIRLFGTTWLSQADYRDVPLDGDLQAVLLDFLLAHQIVPERLAFHARTQSDREGFSLLAIALGKPVGFVRAGPRGTSDGECQALELLEQRAPTLLRVPRLLGRAQLGVFDSVLTTPVLDGYHHPPKDPPLDLIISQIKVSLAELPRPSEVPGHWEPMHGDLAPWNLREDKSGLALVDWEAAGWGPPEADRLFYSVSARALNPRFQLGVPDGESAAYWLERMEQAVNSRDARLRRAMIDVLRSWSS